MRVTCMSCTIQRVNDLVTILVLCLHNPPPCPPLTLSLSLSLYLTSSLSPQHLSLTSTCFHFHQPHWPSFLLLPHQDSGQSGQSQHWFFFGFVLMGVSCDEGQKEAAYERTLKLAKTFVILLWSFFISLGGGLTLAWWELQYHPTNSHQWMVPLGLIMLVTPVIAGFSVFISDICTSSSGQLSASLDDSVHHPV